MRCSKIKVKILRFKDFSPVLIFLLAENQSNNNIRSIFSGAIKTVTKTIKKKEDAIEITLHLFIFLIILLFYLNIVCT